MQFQPAIIDFQFNQIGEDRSVNEDGFRSFVTNELALEDYQKAIANKTVAKCMKYLDKMSHVYEDKINGTKCGWATPILLSCVHMKFLWSCPANLQNQSESCAEDRQVYALIQNLEKYANLEDCCKNENSAEHNAIIRKRFNLANQCAMDLGMFIEMFI